MRGKKKGLQFGRGCCLVWFISHTEVLADVKNFGGFKAGVVLGGVGFYSGKLAAFIFFSIFVESRSFASAFPSFCGAVFGGAPNANIAGCSWRLSCGHGLRRRRGRLPPWPLGRRWGFFFFFLYCCWIWSSPFCSLLSIVGGNAGFCGAIRGSFRFLLGGIVMVLSDAGGRNRLLVFLIVAGRGVAWFEVVGRSVGFYVMPFVFFFLVVGGWTVLWWDMGEGGVFFLKLMKLVGKMVGLI